MSISLTNNIHKNNNFRALIIEPEADKHLNQLSPEERKNLLKIGNRMENYTHFDMIIKEDPFGKLRCDVQAKNNDRYSTFLKRRSDKSLFVAFIPYNEEDMWEKNLETLNKKEAVEFYKNQGFAKGLAKTAITVDVLELNATREDKMNAKILAQKVKEAKDTSYINKLTNKFGTRNK